MFSEGLIFNFVIRLFIWFITVGLGLRLFFDLMFYCVFFSNYFLEFF